MGWSGIDATRGARMEGASVARPAPTSEGAMTKAGDRQEREARDRAERAAARPEAQPVPRQVVVNLNIELHITPGQHSEEDITSCMRAVGEAFREHLQA